jgi:hypothetical protein
METRVRKRSNDTPLVEMKLPLRVNAIWERYPLYFFVSFGELLLASTTTLFSSTGKLQTTMQHYTQDEW